MKVEDLLSDKPPTKPDDVAADTNEPEQQPEPPPKPWKMPQPALGQCIKFIHRSAIRGEASIAWVERTGLRSIVVATRGGGYEDVLHVDDPRLKDNPELRIEIDGTWDFTDDNKQVEERLRVLEEKAGIETPS